MVIPDAGQLLCGALGYFCATVITYHWYCKHVAALLILTGLDRPTSHCLLLALCCATIRTSIPEEKKIAIQLCAFGAR